MNLRAECRKLRRKDMSYREIGQALGCSHTTAAKHCDPAYRARQNENSKNRKP